MYKDDKSGTPGSPEEWFGLGVLYRRSSRFGEAINAFSSAAEAAAGELASVSASAADGTEKKAALEALRSKSLASIELLKEINGFVNADLMNP